MTPQSEVVRYAIDPKASQFTVQAFASGLIAGGTLKLQDELKFRFYVVGRKQN